MRAALPITAFNRTSMESKSLLFGGIWGCSGAFNRTSMESKSATADAGIANGVGLLIEPVWNRNVDDRRNGGMV